MHKIWLFPLSLFGIAFNWFTSLAPGSVDTWPGLEQKFHDYFYNGKVELRFSDLTAVRHKYSETVLEYFKRFREIRNRCYNLTVSEKDLVDLAFGGLSSYLNDRIEGHDFTNVNQVLQWVLVQENHAKDSRSYSRLKDGTGREMERHRVNYTEDKLASDEDAMICMAELFTRQSQYRAPS
jgi:hypothetical protein